MGPVDLVCQVESPGGIARSLQRVGRAGHAVGSPSKGRLLAKTAADLMEAAALTGAMRDGAVEALRVPRHCLDILAQQVVACVAVDPWDVRALYDLVRGCDPYRDLPAEAFESVVAMVSGRSTAADWRDLKPRVSWDRVHNRLVALPGTQRLALGGGGAIPDTGQFPVYLGDGGPAARRAGRGVRLRAPGRRGVRPRDLDLADRRDRAAPGPRRAGRGPAGRHALLAGRGDRPDGRAGRAGRGPLPADRPGRNGPGRPSPGWSARPASIEPSARRLVAPCRPPASRGRRRPGRPDGPGRVLPRPGRRDGRGGPDPPGQPLQPDPEAGDPGVFPVAARPRRRLPARRRRPRPPAPGDGRAAARLPRRPVAGGGRGAGPAKNSATRPSSASGSGRTRAGPC